MSGSDEKSTSYLCCFSGSITLFAQTNKKGYIPGDKIILCGSIVNQSRHQINHLCTRLVQKATYATSTEFPSGESHRTLVEETYEMFCDRSSSVSFSNKSLSVPTCSPSGLPGCGIIDIEYLVQIEAEASVWLSVDIGICGTIDTTFHTPDAKKCQAESNMKSNSMNRPSQNGSYTNSGKKESSKSVPPSWSHGEQPTHQLSIPCVTLTSPNDITDPVILPKEDQASYETQKEHNSKQVLVPIIAPPEGFADSESSTNAINSQSVKTSGTPPERSANQACIPFLTPLKNVLPNIPLSEEEDINGQPSVLPMMPSKDFITNELEDNISTLPSRTFYPIDEAHGPKGSLFENAIANLQNIGNRRSQTVREVEMSYAFLDFF